MSPIQIQADLRGVLRGIKNQNFPLQHALLELIDNSLDAGASSVSIKEVVGDLIICDNGQGFTDIGTALTVGTSTKKDSIGRYGVGLKHAAVRYSDYTTIASNGWRVVAPWQDIIDGASDGAIEALEVKDSGSTSITLHKFRDCYTQAIQTDKIRKAYSELIGDESIKIEVNGDPLPPLPLPDFTTRIEADVSWLGRKAVVVGGIARADDPNLAAWRGYNPFYKGRLIGDGCIRNLGVGEEGCTNFCFIVLLQDGEASWQLATNKDAVDDLAAFLQYIYVEHTASVLKAGAEEYQEIALKDAESETTAALNGSGNQTRKRTGKKPGTVKPTNEGPRKQRTNTATRGGEYARDGGNRRQSLKFRFTRFGDDRLAQVTDMGRQTVIEANLDNSFIEENKESAPVRLCVAKFIHKMRGGLSESDLFSEDLVDSILLSIGEELA